MQLVAAHDVALFLSSFVLDELRAAPNHPDLKRFEFLTTDRVEEFIADLLPRATLIKQIPVQFEYKRDPDDAHYVNLALAADAVYVVSRDNDLLDLMTPTTPESAAFQSRFPTLRIMEPRHFLATVRQSRGTIPR